MYLNMSKFDMVAYFVKNSSNDEQTVLNFLNMVISTVFLEPRVVFILNDNLSKIFYEKLIAIQWKEHTSKSLQSVGKD